MSAQVTDSDGNPNVLNSNRYGGGQWVNTYWDNPDNQWGEDGAFAFPVPATIFISMLRLSRGIVLPHQLPAPAAEHWPCIIKRY